MVCGGRVATTVLLYAHPVRRVSVQRPELVLIGPDLRLEPLAPVLVHDLAATATVGAGGRHLVHHPRLPSVRFHLHPHRDRKSTRLNSSHVAISYAVFCLKKKNKTKIRKSDLILNAIYDSFVLC